MSVEETAPLPLCGRMEFIMKSYILSPEHIPDGMSLHGLLPDLSRMPRDAAHAVSPAVESLSLCPAGGRLRFVTDSSKFELSVLLKTAQPNCACDVLCDGEFFARIGGADGELSYSGTLTLPSGEHLITVFTPRTAPLAEMKISLESDASLSSAPDYRIKKSIVFYGSSITMGAVSSSPSKAYTALVAERLGADHINLGFGGNAKGELAMAEYIASLEMSAFVLDYEHNADTLDDLKRTHKPFFDVIRRARPTLPILIVSRPDTDREFLRSCFGRRIVMDTFHAALDAGDRYVDYVDGFYLWGSDDRAACVSEDGCHPSEHGFAVMADVIYPRLRSLMTRDPNKDTMGRDAADADFPTNI